MYFQLCCYRGDHKNYEEALRCGGVYRTPSTMDCLAFDGSGSSGVFDLAEILDMVLDAQGDPNSLVFGVEHKGQFITLQRLLEAGSKGDIDANDLLMEDF